MVSIVLAIDNALLFRWGKSPNAKLDDLRWRRRLGMLRACPTGLPEVHYLAEKVQQTSIRLWKSVRRVKNLRVGIVDSHARTLPTGMRTFMVVDHQIGFTCTSAMLTHHIISILCTTVSIAAMLRQQRVSVLTSSQ